jgi:hypothetical protein
MTFDIAMLIAKRQVVWILYAVYIYPVKPTITTAKAPSTARIESTSPAFGLPFQE